MRDSGKENGLMMRKTVILCILFLFFAVSAMPAFAAMVLEYDGGVHEYTGSIYTLSVNGNKVTTPLEPIVFNERALVPLREVFEAAGAKVNYNNATKGIYVEGNGVRLLMNIGSKNVTVNGKSTTFPDGLSPKLIAKKGESAKTMVPVRFISETLGYGVDFSGSNININTSEKNAVLESVYCKKSGDAVMITVTANSMIKEIKDAVLTSSNVLYVDIMNSVSELPSLIKLNKGAVLQIRTGVHEGYTRIALDVSNLKNYSVKISSDKKKVMITTVKASESNEKEKVVVIDAGHGGTDGGAGREIEGKRVNEKDINLAVAKKTVEILKSNGVKAEMTRTGDTYPDLYERSAFANSLDAAVFVSIHSNSAGAEAANGIEVYYSTQNNEADYGVKSSELAQRILDAVIYYTKANNRKVKTENHAVTRTSDMPAVLIEIGFITNDEEIKNLLDSDYQYKLASGIAEGILKCLPKITVPDGSKVSFSENDIGDKIS